MAVREYRLKASNMPWFKKYHIHVYKKRYAKTNSSDVCRLSRARSACSSVQSDLELQCPMMMNQLYPFKNWTVSLLDQTVWRRWLVLN